MTLQIKRMLLLNLIDDAIDGAQRDAEFWETQEGQQLQINAAKTRQKKWEDMRDTVGPLHENATVAIQNPCQFE